MRSTRQIVYGLSIVGWCIGNADGSQRCGPRELATLVLDAPDQGHSMREGPTIIMSRGMDDMKTIRWIIGLVALHENHAASLVRNEAPPEGSPFISSCHL